MIAYLDASVLLRLVLGEREPLRERAAVRQAVTSALAETECLRTLDRLSRAGRLTETELAERRGAMLDLLEEVELVEVSGPILRRAGDPFPTSLGTLDAIHLATALAWREQHAPDLVLATHDRELATAGRAVGFEVVGA